MRLKFTLLSALLVTSVDAHSWIYSDIRNPRNQFLLEQNPNRSAWVDSERDAEFCAEDSGMLCFAAEDFRFAIPKGPLQTGARWRHDGVSYQLTDKGRREILGRVHMIHFVEANSGGHYMRFLFSAESGLIAITTVDPPGLLLLLNSKCGFGAPLSCLPN